MKKAFFAGLMILVAVGSSYSQEVDSSCLVPWQNSPLKPHGSDIVWDNSDSVKVDICSGSQYLTEFSKNKFTAAFLYYIIPDSFAPNEDTATHTWQDIDTTYSNLRKGFDTIEQRFGAFTLQHMSENAPDTNKDGKTWWVNFDMYANIDSVFSYLLRLRDINPLLGAGFEGYPSFYESVDMDSSKNSMSIWPEPGNSQLFIEGLEPSDKILFYDPLGRQISLPSFSTNGVLTVDVSKLPNGSYYADLRTDGAHKAVKFSIEH